MGKDDKKPKKDEEPVDETPTEEPASTTECGTIVPNPKGPDC